MFGVQTWVALPDELQDNTASFEHVDAGDVPVERIGGSTVHLGVGTGWGLESPIPGSSPLVLAEVRVAHGSPVPIEVGHPELAVLALDGQVRVDDHDLDAGQLVVLRSGAPAQLGGEGTAMVLGGEPVGPRHIWWNFVHGDRDRIEQAKADWEAQRMPTVPGDHDPYVPLPS